MNKDIKDFIKKIIKEEISQATTQTALPLPPRIQNPQYPKWKPNKEKHQGFPGDELRRLNKLESEVRVLRSSMEKLIDYIWPEKQKIGPNDETRTAKL